MVRLPTAFNVSLISPEVNVAHNQRGGDLYVSTSQVSTYNAD